MDLSVHYVKKRILHEHKIIRYTHINLYIHDMVGLMRSEFNSHENVHYNVLCFAAVNLLPSIWCNMSLFIFEFQSALHIRCQMSLIMLSVTYVCTHPIFKYVFFWLNSNFIIQNNKLQTRNSTQLKPEIKFTRYTRDICRTRSQSIAYYIKIRRKRVYVFSRKRFRMMGNNIRTVFMLSI